MKNSVLVVLIASAVVGFLALGLLFLTTLAWNYVMPVIFGLPEITLMQATALFFLSQVFFNSEVKYTNDKD